MAAQRLDSPGERGDRRSGGRVDRAVRLLARHGTLRTHAPHVAVDLAGDESVASLISDLDQADTSRDLSELRGLDVARERIADGSYGTCIECGGDIGFERLRANPAAERCIRCQTQYERTHASPSGSTL
jgi:RNA polymerase-binding transcription factor DksA